MQVRRTLSQWVEQAAERVFQFITFFAEALVGAAIETVKYAWPSFKMNVLGYYGSISNFCPTWELTLVLFKIVYWGAANAWMFTKTTGSVFLDKAYPGALAHSIKDYVDPDINSAHIFTHQLALDASGVPADVTLDFKWC